MDGKSGPKETDLPSLKLTANAPRNGWLEYDPFLLGYVSFRECSHFDMKILDPFKIHPFLIQLDWGLRLTVF